MFHQTDSARFLVCFQIAIQQQINGIEKKILLQLVWC